MYLLSVGSISLKERFDSVWKCLHSESGTPSELSVRFGGAPTVDDPCAQSHPSATSQSTTSAAPPALAALLRAVSAAAAAAAAAALVLIPADGCAERDEYIPSVTSSYAAASSAEETRNERPLRLTLTPADEDKAWCCCCCC